MRSRSMVTTSSPSLAALVCRPFLPWVTSLEPSPLTSNERTSLASSDLERFLRS